MTEHTTLICENCNTEYSIDEIVCPECGTPNPVALLAEADAEFSDETESPKPWWRKKRGCGSIFIVILIILISILWGGYDGLKERATRRASEVEQHYLQAQQYLQDEQLDLAIAELNQVLTLDPSYASARSLLAELKTRPTPTALPISEPRSNMAKELFKQAQSLTLQGDWQQVIDTYTQIRDINPTYEIAAVSDGLYNANYELGLRFMQDGKFSDARSAFDNALVERPNDLAVTAEWEKVSLYLSLNNADSTDFENTLVVLNRLYALDPTFADTEDRLFNTYLDYAASLSEQKEWCLAQARYESALALRANSDVEILADEAKLKCRNSQTAIIVPTASATLSATQIATATTVASHTIISGSGTLYFDRYNDANKVWEIIALNLNDGDEKSIVSQAVNPAINATGKTLIYHSHNNAAEGLHSYNLQTGEDIRVTTFAEDVLPQWGSNLNEFVFASQRAGDRRWRIFTTFADGKSDAQLVISGQTPTFSPVDDTIYYLGTDAQANNPGIYALKRGGEPLRLTEHDSDRKPSVSVNGEIAFMTARNGSWDIFILHPEDGSIEEALIATSANEGLPVWSPDGSQLVFVSDKDGSWGIYIIDLNADTPSPQKISDWGITHPDWLQQQLSWGY